MILFLKNQNLIRKYKKSFDHEIFTHHILKIRSVKTFLKNIL